VYFNVYRLLKILLQGRLQNDEICPFKSRVIRLLVSTRLPHYCLICRCAPHCYSGGPFSVARHSVWAVLNKEELGQVSVRVHSFSPTNHDSTNFSRSHIITFIIRSRETGLDLDSIFLFGFHGLYPLAFCDSALVLRLWILRHTIYTCTGRSTYQKTSRTQHDPIHAPSWIRTSYSSPRPYAP
jgi:hypothetical protein